MAHTFSDTDYFELVWDVLAGVKKLSAHGEGGQSHRLLFFAAQPPRTLLGDGDDSTRPGENNMTSESNNELTNGGWRALVLSARCAIGQTRFGGR